MPREYRILLFFVRAIDTNALQIRVLPIGGSGDSGRRAAA